MHLYCIAAVTILACACTRRAAPAPSPASPALPAARTLSPEQEARAVAEPWLLLIDGGQYGRSWDEAATAFKAAITREGWESAVAAAIGPLGRLQAREVGSARYTDNLPGAPPGKYVVLQNNCVFAERPAVETVVLVQEGDGKWRVAGYFVN